MEKETINNNELEKSKNEYNSIIKYYYDNYDKISDEGKIYYEKEISRLELLLKVKVAQVKIGE